MRTTITHEYRPGGDPDEGRSPYANLKVANEELIRLVDATRIAMEDAEKRSTRGRSDAAQGAAWEYQGLKKLHEELEAAWEQLNKEEE